MLFGYARAINDNQQLEMQINAIRDYGVDPPHIFSDQFDGVAKPVGLAGVVEAMRQGSILVVWKLDRLGRNLSELIQTVDFIRQQEAQIVSITENVDTTTSPGKHLFQLIGMLAQYERDMLSERTKASLAMRKRSGKSLGRKTVIKPGSDRWKEVVALVREGLSFVEIANRLKGISKSTLYNNANELRAEAAVLDSNEMTRK